VVKQVDIFSLFTGLLKRLLTAPWKILLWIAGDGGDENGEHSNAPVRDETGKVHGDLPDYVPDNWTDEDVEVGIEELEKSIDFRKQEQLRLGEHGPHRERIRQEEKLLRQLRKKQSGS
jgi:hypothetical protein